MELVAPAGSLAALKAAVEAGADAVYLGLKNATNARNFAGLNFTEADIRAYCEKVLTGYKRPKHIAFRDELPKTNVGKILRRALRDEKQPA